VCPSCWSCNSCYCHSVCLSVCLSNACFVTKWNNRQSVCQHHTIEWFFLFLRAKFRGPEFRGSPRTTVLKTGKPTLSLSSLQACSWSTWCGLIDRIKWSVVDVVTDCGRHLAVMPVFPSSLPWLCGSSLSLSSSLFSWRPPSPPSSSSSCYTADDDDRRHRDLPCHIPTASTTTFPAASGPPPRNVTHPRSASGTRLHPSLRISRNR